MKPLEGRSLAWGLVDRLDGTRLEAGSLVGRLLLGSTQSDGGLAKAVVLRVQRKRGLGEARTTGYVMGTEFWFCRRKFWRPLHKNRMFVMLLNCTLKRR